MHSLLARQLQKAFGRTEGFAPPLQHLLELVDAAYRQGDHDRLMLERAMDLSSAELVQANAELRALFST
ncbi:MAG: hypothetical protein N2Z74_07450, partial [Syntrophales bacterium]|nr:hypothetical protein [Syntrophales bacterium]